MPILHLHGLDFRNKEKDANSLTVIVLGVPATFSHLNSTRITSVLTIYVYRKEFDLTPSTFFRFFWRKKRIYCVSSNYEEMGSLNIQVDPYKMKSWHFRS